jgi:hypothetical protein
MIKTAVMKLLTVKAAAVFALAAAGGVAVAATTGTLPTTLTGSEHSTSGMSAASSDHAGGPSARPSASEKGKGRDGEKDGNNQNGNHNGDQNGNQSGNGPEGANGSPSPSLVGLCHAVDAGNKDDHGKALENPAFTALITAAGGKEKVDAFCATLLASASAAPKEHPSHPANDSSDHNGKPSAAAQP